MEVIDDISSLALVRGDNTNLFGLHSSFFKIEHDFLNSGSLSPVQIRGSRSRKLLSSIKVKEEAGLIIWPRETLVYSPIPFRDTVL